MGSVSGGGNYEYGDTALLTATANDHYRFVSWNDGNTENPRAIVVLQDTTLIAIFEMMDGVEDWTQSSPILIYPNPTTGILYIVANQVNIIEICDLRGRKIAQYKNRSEIDISTLPNGIYLVRVMDLTGNAVYKVIKQ
jgi:hypothetical protein